MEVPLVVTAAILCLSSNLVLATDSSKRHLSVSGCPSRKELVLGLLSGVHRHRWQSFSESFGQEVPTYDETFGVAVEELMSIKSDREAGMIVNNLLDYFEVAKLRSKVSGKPTTVQINGNCFFY